MCAGRIGPGPARYTLPPTVGYPNHDPSRYRNPQYSMRPRVGMAGKPFGPGPKYMVERMNQYGKDQPPAYSIAMRLKGLGKFVTPAPNRYNVEAVPRMKEPRPPAYSIAKRFKPLSRFNTPGPDKYSLPSALGPKVPDKNAAAAYSMAQKYTFSGRERSPGPARYDPVMTDLYKNKQPRYTMQARNMGVTNKNITPAANKYNVKLPGPCMKGFSFGLRTGTPYITPEDAMPCINK